MPAVLSPPINFAPLGPPPNDPNDDTNPSEPTPEAVRPIPPVISEVHFPEICIAVSLAALAKHQALNNQTHATHAAAFYVPEGNLVIRDDVGRHNALDKLAGALSFRNIDPARGAIGITSRVSVEMVQKAARIGAPILIAISAPTGLAVQTAERANITLVAMARTFVPVVQPRRSD